jgi:hypothetical protein
VHAGAACSPRQWPPPADRTNYPGRRGGPISAESVVHHVAHLGSVGCSALIFGTFSAMPLMGSSTRAATHSAGPNASVEGGLYGIGAGVSVADGIGFWVNSVKTGGPGGCPPFSCPRAALHQRPLHLCREALSCLLAAPDRSHGVTPAEAAGIRTGSLIVSIQGRRPKSLGLRSDMSRCRTPGWD